MEKSESVEKFNSKSDISDRFEIPHNHSKYLIESSIDRENIDLVIKSQKIHGQCYVDYGYVNDGALTNDGRLVPELDGTRDREDGTVVVNYLLAREPGKSIDEAVATMRLIGIGDKGTIEDLPTYRYFKNSFNSDTQAKLKDLIDLYGPKSVREIAALGVTGRADNGASYELMRAVMQNSLIKETSYNNHEFYVASLTKQSLRPVLKFTGSKAFEILGDPVRIYANDPRQKEVYVTPVLIYPNKILDGILDEIESSKKDAEINILAQKLIYLTDGLSNDQVSERVAIFLNKINN